MRPDKLHIMQTRRNDMKKKRFWSFRLAAVLVLLFLGVALFVTRASAGSSHNETRFRWDIVSIDFTKGTVGPGGMASATAIDKSMITLTGHGTFVPEGGFGNDNVTGGGTWQTFDPSGNSTGSGTYEVTGFVSWLVAPGVFPPLKDLIGDPAKAHSGLVSLAIQYSNGSTGVLTVSCHLPGPPAISPPSIFEGIRASMGFTDYWNGIPPPAPPGNANRTVFHVVG
jgi:hypothetical protein